MIAESRQDLVEEQAKKGTLPVEEQNQVLALDIPEYAEDLAGAAAYFAIEIW